MWSPLEYACHVHDVHQVFHERLTAMMTERRAALRQLGPGHDGRRAPLRPAGARDRRADPGGLGVRRGRPLRLGPGRRLGSQGHPQRRQRVQHRLAREVPPPRHRAPPARRGDVGGAGDHRLLRRVRRRVRLGHQRHARRGHRTTSTTSSTSSAPRRGCWRSARAPGATPLALEQIGLSVRRTDITRAFVERLRAAGYLADQLDPLRDDLTDTLRGGAPYDGIWAGASLLHVRAGVPADRAAPGSPRSPGPGAPCT